MTIAAEVRVAEVADAETVGQLVHDFTHESLGFSKRESNGALNFFYEREL